MKKQLAAIIACAFISLPAFAEKASGIGDGCSMNESATVSITFNGSDKDVTQVKNRLDDKIKEIKALAENEHFDKFDIQSNNYSINSNNYSGGGDGETTFQYNGSASFVVLPAERALDFMVVLTKKGYHANVNVNSYRGGNCNQVLR